MSKRIRFTTMVNRPPQATGHLSPATIIETAKRIERDGWDVLSYADWAVGDVFAPLMLIAQATERVEILTRVVASATRSPLLLASGAAWVDRVSHGRFVLGMGASIPDVVQGRHGLPYALPGSRMIDTLRIIRALWGDAVPGVEHNPDGSFRYHGNALQVERAFVDALPERRVPIMLAASGPRMMRIAGALADGVILELTTPQYVHWAMDQIRAGAAEAGRTLEGFEVCVQTSIRLEDDDPATAVSRQWGLDFMINHCVYPEFKHLWPAAGLEAEAQVVRDAVARGDRETAGRIVIDQIYPKMVVTGPRQALPAAFTRWLTDRIAAGTTMFALPGNVQDMVGMSLANIKDVLKVEDS